MSRTVGPEHSGGCVLTLGAQLRGDVVAAQGGLVALFPWGICPLVSKYALRSPDSPDWQRSPVSWVSAGTVPPETGFPGGSGSTAVRSRGSEGWFSLGEVGVLCTGELFVTPCDHVPILYLFIFKPKVEDLPTKLAQLHQHRFTASTGELSAGSLGLQTKNAFSSRKL